MPYRELRGKHDGSDSATMREQVLKARETQRHRFGGDSTTSNARMGSRPLRKHCVLDAAGEALLKAGADRIGGLSARAHEEHRQVARTHRRPGPRASNPIMSARRSCTAGWTGSCEALAAVFHCVCGSPSRRVPSPSRIGSRCGVCLSEPVSAFFTAGVPGGAFPRPTALPVERLRRTVRTGAPHRRWRRARAHAQEPPRCLRMVLDPCSKRSI